VIKIFISWKREDILRGLDPSLDYRRYHSSLLNLEFDYPQAQLTVDTTQEDKRVIPVELVYRYRIEARWIGIFLQAVVHR
jgi:hypothetical protein